MTSPISFGDGTNAGYVEADTNGGASTSVSATLGWAQATGDLILVEVSFAVSVGPVVAGYPQDTSGNVYTFVESQTDPSSNFTVALYECRSAKKANAGANAVTVHVTTAGAAGDLLITVNGATAPGYVWIRDQINKSSGTSATPANGSITTTFANTFAVALITVGNTIVSPFPGAPWVNQAVDPNGGLESYAISTATATLAPTYNQSPSGVYAALIAAYGASPAAPTVVVNQRAPGFPRSAPPPGIARLGSGVLVATTPAGVARTMSATIQGTATVTDALAVARAMIAAIVGQAGATFNLYRVPFSPPLIVQARAPGFPIGAPIPGIARLGSGILAQTTTTGVARSMGVAIQGQGTETEAMSVARPLADTITGHGSLTDALSVARALSVAIAGSAVVGDTMAVARAMVDAVHGQASMTDAMSVARAMVDAIVGHASASDALNVSRPLVVSMGGQAVVAFSLSLSVPGTPSSVRVNARPPGVPMSFPLPGVARLGSGILVATSPGAVIVAMQVSIAGQATTLDTMAVKRALVDAMAGAGVAGVSAGVLRSLQDAIHGQASDIAAMTVVRGMLEAIAGKGATTFGPLPIARGMANALHAMASLGLPLSVARSMMAAIQGHALAAFANSQPTVFITMNPTITVSTAMAPTTIAAGDF